MPAREVPGLAERGGSDVQSDCQVKMLRKVGGGHSVSAPEVQGSAAWTIGPLEQRHQLLGRLAQIPVEILALLLPPPFLPHLPLFTQRSLPCPRARDCSPDKPVGAEGLTSVRIWILRPPSSSAGSLLHIPCRTPPASKVRPRRSGRP